MRIIKRTRREIEPAYKIPPPGGISNTTIARLVKNRYHTYAEMTIEDRAVPDFRDGLIPVYRRILWTMYEMGLHYNRNYRKLASVAGTVMGDYHPHGDMAINDAAASLSQQHASVAMLDGQGNWGDYDSRQGGSRYIECRLSEYTNKVLLDPYYLAVVPMVPSYDGRKKEPLFLPSLLPNILFFGMEGGIAVGTTSMFPPFHPDGVMQLVRMLIQNKAVSAETCAAVLQMNYRWGGWIVSSVPDMVNFYQTGESTIRFSCDYSIDGNILTITGIPPRWNFTNNLERLQKDDDVISITQHSKKDIKVIVKIRPEAVNKSDTVQRLDRILQSYMAARANVTMRYMLAGEIAEAGADFRATNILTILRNWLRWRVALERRATGAHLADLREQIRRQTLLRKAVDHSDFIIEAVRNRRNLSDDMIENQLMTKLQISREEVKEILELRIRQLTHLSGQRVDEILRKLQQERIVGEQQLLQPLALVIDKTGKLLNLLSK